MPTTHTTLIFPVAGARLGLRVSHVLEVLPVVALHKPPEMPGLVAGFLALDDAVVPVVRLERLLRLDLGGAAWNPEETLSSQIVVAKLPGGLLGWFIGPGAGIERYKPAEAVRLPAGHTLNSCAQWVIARPPPEPSIVLLEPDRLLFEKERICIEEFRLRAEERLAALLPAPDSPANLPA